MAKVVIVDEHDSEVTLKTYDELRYEDIYRVTTLWLTDLENKYCLVTQRKWTKRNDPGKWMMAVSGTVEEGEDYDENMVVEIEEEIGLTGVTTKKEAKNFIDDGLHKFFVQYYSAQIDKETKITIQEEEVEQYQWILISELLEWVNMKPEDFVPSMKESLKAVGALGD
jgi:isopentenyldiphosphate isomerase